MKNDIYDISAPLYYKGQLVEWDDYSNKAHVGRIIAVSTLYSSNIDDTLYTSYHIYTVEKEGKTSFHHICESHIFNVEKG